jgi:hypothetical protein
MQPEAFHVKRRSGSGQRIVECAAVAAVEPTVAPPGCRGEGRARTGRRPRVRNCRPNVLCRGASHSEVQDPRHEGVERDSRRLRGEGEQRGVRQPRDRVGLQDRQLVAVG